MTRPKSRGIIETARAAVHNVSRPDHRASRRSPKLFQRWVLRTENQWFTGGVRRYFAAGRRGCFPNRMPLTGVMSVDVGEDAVELVEAVVADHQLAFATGRMLDRNLRAKLLRQFLLETVYVRVTWRVFRHLARW
jgi:hypothetical protein